MDLLEWAAREGALHFLLPALVSDFELEDEDDSAASASAAAPDDAQAQFPSELPILPLRGVVAYPHVALPLTIGQPRSIRLMDEVTSGDRLVGLVTARDPENETPGPEDLYPVGTIAVVHRLLRSPDGSMRILVQGLARFRLGAFVAEEPYLKARIELIPETVETGLEIEALKRNVLAQFEHIARLIPSFPDELLASVASLEDPLDVAYTIANFQRMELETAQEILELDSAVEKLRRLLTVLLRESQMIELGQKIQNEAREEMEKVQREYFLREQLKAIRRELGEKDEQAAEVEKFRRKIEAAGMSEEAYKQALEELDRMANLPVASAEYGVIRTYLDWLTAIPWQHQTEDNLDLERARAVLEEDHYGLEDVKDRILEFLAVRKLRLERGFAGQKQSHDLIRREREGVILCFVGPPGVGKTSLGRSIARAMERKFVRMSLGGLHDEAEIRGHRRTYIGAMPGRIMQSLRRIGTRNPVFMLDEIDKLGMDFRGDPASALLEVLDPEQNAEFRDNYLDVAFDLSQVMFIATANSLHRIPGPLRDRMEIIRLAGYTENEKVEIARRYLVPRQIRENGLLRKEIRFYVAALRQIIRGYTREAGVRELERKVGAICRKVSVEVAQGKAELTRIDKDAVRAFLGSPPFRTDDEINLRISRPGVVPGLAWTAVGGEILFVEAALMPGGKGFQVTGSVGHVMQESARAALSLVRANARKYGLPARFFDKHDIHLHVPEGAQPKDGPSAGVTMVVALVSLLSGRKVRRGVAMTGEITLRGQVLRIGGLKDKVLAAYRYGLKTVILPHSNAPDLEEVPEEIREKMRFVLVKTVDEALEAALVPPRSAAKPAAKDRTA